MDITSLFYPTTPLPLFTILKNFGKEKTKRQYSELFAHDIIAVSLCVYYIP